MMVIDALHSYMKEFCVKTHFAAFLARGSG